MQIQRSTWDILGPLGTHAWSRSLVIPKSDTTVGAAYDGLLAVKLDGSGQLSKRTMTGMTGAANALLDGSMGARLQELLRTTLAAFDGREGIANVQGFIFADTDARASLATGAAYANVINDMGVRKLVPGAQPTRAMRADAQGVLKIGTSAIDFAGFAPDWIILTPRATAPLLDLARIPASQLTAEQARAGARALAVLRHEIAHTIEPLTDPSKALRSQIVKPYGFPLNKVLTMSRMGWLADRGLLQKLQQASVSPTLWLEESIADLDSMDQREGAQLLGTLGLPVTPATVAEFRPGYPPYHAQLDRLFALAGIDRTTPQGLATARELLQTTSLSAAPERLAAAIVTHRQADPALVGRIAALIAEAGRGVSIGSRELPAGFRAKIDEVERLVGSAA